MRIMAITRLRIPVAVGAIFFVLGGCLASPVQPEEGDGASLRTTTSSLVRTTTSSLDLGPRLSPGTVDLLVSTASSVRRAGADVGSLPGSVSVTARGEARYSIPITVPSARDDSAPSVSLEYGADDGLVGVGWSLSGFSSVGRCRRTTALDKEPSPIQFDDSDAFCLGSERLEPIRGENGRDGTEYRTIIDSGVRIRSYGRSGAAPERFTVEPGDGSITTYATLAAGPRLSSDDPDGVRLEVDLNKVALRWLPTRREDASGNITEFEWAVEVDGADEYALEYRPLAIRYGGNTNTGAPSLRSVEFHYEPRKDVRDAFVSGLHLRWSHRLKRVTTHAPVDGGVQLIRSYELEHTESEATGRSLLASVQERGALGGAKPATRFEYGGASNFAKPIQLAKAAGGALGIYAFDGNGDGRRDLVIPREHHDTLVLMNQGDARFEAFEVSGPSGFGRSSAPTILDLTGDRVDELVSASGHIRRWNSYDKRFDEIGEIGELFFASSGELDGPSSDSIPRTTYSGDFDGDGAPDLFRRVHVDGWHRAKLQWAFTPGDPRRGVDGVINSVSTGVAANDVVSDLRNWEMETRVVDLDGDGSSELLYPAPGEPDGDGRRWLSLSMRDGSPITEKVPVRLGLHLTFADINGDGLEDLLDLLPRKSTTPRVRINLGRGFGPWRELLAPGTFYRPPGQTASSWRLQDPAHRPFDLDGDGRADLATLDPRSGVVLYASRGRHLVESPTDYQIPSPAARSAAVILTQPIDINGDGALDLVSCTDDDAVVCVAHLRTPQATDALVGVTNGRGIEEQVYYTTLSDRVTHTAGKDCEWPQTCPASGRRVVRSVAREREAGVMVQEMHSYARAVVDRVVGGLVGFARHDIHYPAAQRAVFQDFDLTAGPSHTYPFASSPSRVLDVTRLAERRVVGTRTEHERQVVGREAGRVLGVRNLLTVRSDLEGAAAPTPPATGLDRFIEIAYAEPLRVVRTTYEDFDAQERPQRTVVDVEGGDRTTLVRKYEDRVTPWTLGLLTREERTSESASGDSRTIASTRSYDERGRLITRSEATNIPDATQTTSIGRGADGVVESITLEAAGERRTYAYGYEPERVFATRITDPLGYTSEVWIHGGLGVVVRERDANGLISRRAVDDFGRMVAVTRPGGVNITRERASLPGGGIRTTTTRSDGAWTVSDQDAFGNRVALRRLGFDGKTILERWGHDHFGRMRWHERPHFEGSPSEAYDRFEYDLRGRQTLVTLPDGSSTRREYAGRQIDSWDEVGRHRQAFLDLNGRTERVVEYLDGRELVTHYEHGVDGQLEQVRGPDGATTSVEYDALGRRSAVVDPNAGRREMLYDAWGQLAYELRPGDVELEYHYDVLGRVTRIDGPEGSWTYTHDTAPGGRGVALGALHEAVSPDGVRTRYRYDAQLRPTRIDTTIEGTAFTESFSYDTWGRLATATLPGSRPLTLRYGYDARGALQEVRRGDDDRRLWQQTETNALELAEEIRFGNGTVSRRSFDPLTGRLDRLVTQATRSGFTTLQDLQYGRDATGAITSLADRAVNRFEYFFQDDLGRLKDWWTYHDETWRNETYTFDDGGNLTEVRTPEGREGRTYGGEGAGPHLLTSVSGVGSLRYDESGRLHEDAQRRFTWTAFDLPRLVEANGGSSRFAYDAWNQRAFEQTDDKATYSVGSTFRRRVDGPRVTDVSRVVVDGRAVAEVHRSGSTEKTLYLHADALGSPTVVTDEGANVVERQFFSPFGRRVDESGRAPSAIMSLPVAGFTGHEHDDGLGLINMGGRVYDPRYARFLTPDPFVHDEQPSQGLNRYAYVFNMPMRYSDPSGFDPSDMDAFDDLDIVTCSGGVCDVDPIPIEGSVEQEPPLIVLDEPIQITLEDDEESDDLSSTSEAGERSRAPSRTASEDEGPDEAPDLGERHGYVFEFTAPRAVWDNRVLDTGELGRIEIFLSPQRLENGAIEPNVHVSASAGSSALQVELGSNQERATHGGRRIQLNLTITGVGTTEASNERGGTLELIMGLASAGGSLTRTTGGSRPAEEVMTVPVFFELDPQTGFYELTTCIPCGNTAEYQSVGPEPTLNDMWKGGILFGRFRGRITAVDPGEGELASVPVRVSVDQF